MREQGGDIFVHISSSEVGPLQTPCIAIQRAPIKQMIISCPASTNSNGEHPTHINHWTCKTVEDTLSTLWHHVTTVDM